MNTIYQAENHGVPFKITLNCVSPTKLGLRCSTQGAKETCGIERLANHLLDNSFGEYPLTVGIRCDYSLPVYRPPKLAAGERTEMFPNDPKAVAFVCIDRRKDADLRRIPIGTAFFVLVPYQSSSNLSWVYVVTARHIIEDAELDKIYIRVNRRDSGFDDIVTARDDWSIHDNADVAAILFVPPNEQALDYASIPIWGFVGADYRFKGPPFEQSEGLPVQIGHQVFFLGLFTQNFGRDRNLPIARFGHISRMPDTVQLQRWKGSTTFQTTAYLAECHSWGGHSGSPTFWQHPMTRERKVSIEGQEVTVQEIGNFQAFLGLVSAHYNIPQEAKTTGDIWGTIKTGLNSGIAILTPAEAIRQLLMREDFVEDREQRKNKADAQEPKPTMDMAPQEFTEADFEEALRRVSRRLPISEPDSESSQT